ncbi:MAG: flagellar motor switch protein FliM [Fimbriimonadaceae bacterium]|nr:flagellar motor switch protein FliM [Fimbriimonadaceae bacterium]
MDGMLSQEEIDALLAQTATAGPTAPLLDGGDAAQEVKLYDFKRPEKFSREQLRNLERIHERFARLLSTTLSAYIRTNIVVKIESVTPLSYHEFVYSLPQPTLIHVIEMEPLPGQAALEITPTVVFPMYEQMLGGKVRRQGRTRQLTDVELVLFQRPLERMLSCLAETWQDFVKIKPRMVRAEQDPQFAQVAATNTPVVVVSLEVTIGEDFGMMSLCMPDVLADALLYKLGQERITSDRSTADRDRLMMRDVVSDVTLLVRGELGRSALTVRQIRGLQKNDVIRLDSAPGQPIGVYIGDRLLYEAEAGQLQRKVAVRLSRKHEVPEPFQAVVDDLQAQQPVAPPPVEPPADDEVR